MKTKFLVLLLLIINQQAVADSSDLSPLTVAALDARELMVQADGGFVLSSGQSRFVSSSGGGNNNSYSLSFNTNGKQCPTNSRPYVSLSPVKVNSWDNPLTTISAFVARNSNTNDNNAGDGFNVYWNGNQYVAYIRAETGSGTQGSNHAESNYGQNITVNYVLSCVPTQNTANSVSYYSP